MKKPGSELAVLKAARELITPPEMWCKYFPATDDKGHAVPPKSGNAASFCAYGAIERVAPTKSLDHKATMILKSVTPGGFAAMFNDREKTKHKDVLRIFDKAIKSLTSQQPSEG